MKKIILIDDDNEMQEIVRLAFKKTGYDILAFSNGFSFFKNNYALPDVFILDKQLPGLDGLEICRKLKQGEKTKDIPVIMLSANPDIKSLAKEAGANEAVEKPFMMSALRQIVARYIN